MRNALIFSIVFWLTDTSTAQDSLSGKPYLFLTLGNGYGTHTIFNISLDFIFRNNYFVSLGGHFQSRKSPDIPWDYYSGFRIFGDGKPKVRTELFALSFGKAMLFQKWRLRYILSAGLGTGIMHKPDHFVPSYKLPMLFDPDPNYTFVVEEHITFGILLSPRVFIPLSRRIGLSVGMVSFLGKHEQSVGAVLLLHLGELRRGKP